MCVVQLYKRGKVPNEQASHGQGAQKAAKQVGCDTMHTLAVSGLS